MPNTAELKTLLLQQQEDDRKLLELKKQQSTALKEDTPKEEKKKGLVPESYSQIGKGLESMVDEKYHAALKMGEDTLKSMAFQPVLGYGSKLSIENPELVARTSSAIIAPWKSMFGQAARFLMNQGLQTQQGVDLLDSALLKAQENVKKQIKSDNPTVFNPLFDKGKDAARNWITSLTNDEAHSTLVNLAEVIGVGASTKVLAGTKWQGTLLDLPITGKVKGFLHAKNATKAAMQNPANFSREVRGAVIQNKHEKLKGISDPIDNFTKQNPDMGVDISDPIDNFRQALNDPDSASDLRRIIGAIMRKSKNQTLKTLIENPDAAKSLNMRQLQDLKNSIEYFPSIQSKISKGAWDKITLGEQDLLNLVDDIKFAQTDIIPTLKGARQAYSAFMEDYKQIRPLLSERVLEKHLRSNFSGQTGEVVERIARSIPENLRGQITAFSQTSIRNENAKQLLKKGIGWFVGGLAARKGWQLINRTTDGWGGTGG